MAGKHSKSFLDSLKEIKFNNTVTCTRKPPLLLPFKIIIAVLVLALTVSAVWAWSFFMPGKSNQKLLAKAAQIFNTNDSVTALNELYLENNDIKAWIKIDGTNINNPVCQTDNNSYYMNHNHLGKKSRYGALFLMSEDDLEANNNDHNSVIYGNNMKDESMFGQLKKYRNINFYKQNPTINLYYGKNADTYIVFSVMLISASEDDNNSTFDPSKSYFANENEFYTWITEANLRSLIKTNIEVKYDDNILTLVTVANDFEGARLVVMAKRLEDVEIPYIDTSKALVNSKTKYPKIWYTTKGLEYPY